MAILKAEVEFSTDFIQEIAKTIPEINGGFLSFVGSRARTLLKERLLSGQELDAFGDGASKGKTKDKIGRYLVSSDVNKKQTETKIYSYMVNLFENGRTLRDGSREAGQDIIGVKLKQMVTMNMASYVNEYEPRIQKELDKI